MDRSSQGRAAPLYERLGVVTVAGRPALVLWPGCGDAVAIDFIDNGNRYAAAYHLDGAARLDPQPRYEELLNHQQLDSLLASVISLWPMRWSACS